MKKAKKLVKSIFPKASVEFGIKMVVTGIGDPRLSKLLELKQALRKAKLINKHQQIDIAEEEEGFSLSCILIED